jgi:transposase InsO family protein
MRICSSFGIDILTSVNTREGNRFLLVTTDRFSKLDKAVTMPKITADAAVAAFFVHWIACYGAPVLLLSDNGAQFSAKLFQAICATLAKIADQNLATAVLCETRAVCATLSSITLVNRYKAF